jgi:dienelactone hydrolase
MRLILTIAGVVSITFSTGCVTHCPKETLATPTRAKFERLTVTLPGKSEVDSVWRTRSPGKPILLFHAINGISPALLEFALEMETWGYRVYLPSLYGDPIMGESAYGYDMALEALTFLKEDERWNLHGKDNAGPILDEVLAWTDWVKGKEPGKPLAVIGNCLSGSFPLAVLAEPGVELAVLAQPALPVVKYHEIFLRLPQSEEKQRGLGIPDETMEKLAVAMRKNPNKRIVGFHYVHDPLAPIAKYDALHDFLSGHGLADRFEAVVLKRPGSRFLNSRHQWASGADTAEPLKLLTPHSTIANPESSLDRKWFRSELRKRLTAGGSR